MAAVQKEQNRASQEGNKPEDRKQQHQEAAVGGVSAQAVSGDSPVASREVKKAVAKKKASKKG